MTILEAVLSLAGFTGSSIAGGLTWDILKHSGAKIIRSFKSRFASGEKKRFSGEEECEEFLKELAEKTPNSRKNPYKDVKIIYEDYAQNPDEDFIAEFQQWIEASKISFEQMRDGNVQLVSVRIGHQENTGSGTIVNAGIINHNYR